MSRDSFPFTRASAALLVALSLPLSLAGCGSDDGGGDDGAALSVTPSLGLVRHATVVVKDALGNTVGSGTTAADGIARFSASADGPYVIEVHGDADAEYFDEHIGDFVPFTSGVLHALVPAGATEVAVTGLTELAWSLWQSGNSVPLTDGNIALANDAILDLFAPSAPGGLDDLLDAPTLLGDTPDDGDLSGSAADLHALLLAALAALGDGDPDGSPALSVILQLSQDLSDGVIDGEDGDGPITGLLYDDATLTSDLATALDALGTAWGDGALEALADAYTPGTLATPDWEGVSDPVIVTGLSASSGAAGDTITITGTGFDADPFHMEVKFFPAVAATIVSASTTELVVTVPEGATTGPVWVNNAITGFSFTTESDFTVTGGSGGGGDTWTSRASPGAYVFTNLTYGNSTFVAVGMGKTIMTSSDGVSWSNGTSPDSAWFQANGVTHDGTNFILVGDTNNYTTPMPIIATSTDGTTWTRRNWTQGSTTEYSLTDVAAGGGKVTAVGANGVILASTDNGATWSGESQSWAAAFHGVASNGTTRVAVGRDGGYYGIILVNTGSSWTLVSGITNFYPNDVTWTGTQFVAVGAVSSSGNANPVVMTSPDGSTWTRYALPAEEASTGKPLQEVIWDSTRSKLFATGYDASTGQLIVSSTNGSTWAIEYEATVSGNGSLAGLAASATRVVTVGGVKSVTLP